MKKSFYEGQFPETWGALYDRGFEVDYNVDNKTLAIEVEEVRVLGGFHGERVMPEWFVAILVSDSSIMREIENHAFEGTRDE